MINPNRRYFTPSWIAFFREEAYSIASKSKDTTKVGAVLIGDDNEILIKAYNGPAIGVSDTSDRFSRENGVKYFYASHAERNLISFAAKYGISLKGKTIYTTHYCCADCANSIAQSGIACVIVGNGTYKSGTNLMLQHSCQILIETGVQVIRDYSDFDYVRHAFYHCKSSPLNEGLLPKWRLQKLITSFDKYNDPDYEQNLFGELSIPLLQTAIYYQASNSYPTGENIPEILGKEIAIVKYNNSMSETDIDLQKLLTTTCNDALHLYIASYLYASEVLNAFSDLEDTDPLRQLETEVFLLYNDIVTAITESSGRTRQIFDAILMHHGHPLTVNTVNALETYLKNEHKTKSSEESVAES